MQLQLDRPLAVFDLETTGINQAADRIVEIGIIKLHPDGKREQFYSLVNPEMIIPDHAAKIHGITNKKVALEPTFEALAPKIAEFLEGCDLGGFNSNKFDIPVLHEEFSRVGFPFTLEGRRLIDAQVIFHRMEERTLSAAYKFYCDKDLENAHSALADSEATLDVLLAQVERYQELPKSSAELHEFSRGKSKKLDMAGRFALNDEDVPVFNFGKHRGKPVEDVLKDEPGYYGWMLNAEFPQNTKDVLKKIKEQIDQKNSTK
ncbi:3'-5' exonuclease [Luteibaculum oceani]|uniref:3'-5' exonuclease n=1 Tax=Luteibaculum oceani TaxID=1294296 RepID=A0A5C6VBM4_9FLAO|nr:3'-5' exonuclease [Luteibaculum oceani]TXC82061.1 3'-5' exonuclease [Luteibaculum oceani]